MHILFDSLSGQVQVHRRLKIRMNTLLGAIQSEGWTHSFSRDPISPGKTAITPGQLDGCDVLAILTREHLSFDPYATNPDPSPSASGWPYKYEDSEKQAIKNFVKNGGGLLLISNHGPKPKSGDTGGLGDTKYDVDLAAHFDIVLHPAHFNAVGNTLMNMGKTSLNSALDDDILFQVKEIAVHNCCGIQLKKGVSGVGFKSIAMIPTDAVDSSPRKVPSKPNFTPTDMHYAVTLNNGKGRVIVAGNSGLAGDDGSTYPAAGTILYGNNLLFLLNCFKYLAGIAVPKNP